MVLGLSAGLLLLLSGQIAGISGIVGRLLGGHKELVNGAFVVGLLAGPALYAAAHGALAVMTISASWPVIILAGLLVGIGTRMGSGCTSGHGILGLARVSKRSIVATANFLLARIAVALLSGAPFGYSLSLSGMVDPARVIDFLDITQWSLGTRA